MVGNTYVQVFVENVASSGIAIHDLGLPNIPPGVAFDISGQIEDSELRRSDDFRRVVEQDLVTVSGKALLSVEGVLEGDALSFSKESVLLWLAGVDSIGQHIYLKPVPTGPGTWTTTAVNLDDTVKRIRLDDGTTFSGTVTFSGTEFVSVDEQEDTVVITATGVASDTALTTVSGALYALIAESDDVDSITVSGVTVTGSVTFDTVGGTSLSADAASNTVTVSGGGVADGQFEGDMIQAEFAGTGNTSNAWLSVSTKDLTSNITPFSMVYPCRIAALGFSNQKDGVDIDIEIYKSLAGAGSTATLEDVWEIRDTRIAHRSDYGTTGPAFAEGDKFAMYARRVPGGTAPSNVLLSVYLEITSTVTANATEDYSGNFSI